MTDSYRKYDHVERLGHREVHGIDTGTVHVFPKLDGTNGVVWFDQDSGKVLCGSRNKVCTIEQDNAGFAAWVNSEDPKAVALRAFCVRYPHLIVYGEWMVPHTLKTYYDGVWRRFWIFDVYFRGSEGAGYLSFGNYSAMPHLNQCDLIYPIAVIDDPTPERLAVMLATNTYLIQQGAGVGEGIVLKNYLWVNRFGRQPWAKMIHEEFSAGKREPKSGPDVSVESTIADEFCTATLVNKTRAKIRVEIANSEGVAVEDVESAYRSKVIPRLIGSVYHDLVVEEIWAILKKRKGITIDFNRLAYTVAERTKELAKDLFS